MAERERIWLRSQNASKTTRHKRNRASSIAVMELTLTQALPTTNRAVARWNCGVDQHLRYVAYTHKRQMEYTSWKESARSRVLECRWFLRACRKSTSPIESIAMVICVRFQRVASQADARRLRFFLFAYAVLRIVAIHTATSTTCCNIKVNLTFTKIAQRTKHFLSRNGMKGTGWISLPMQMNKLTCQPFIWRALRIPPR